ncbi:hypothetical protein P280DRAFT_522236 [Massarina eburnea CBS 473.64]|uniref:Uncharacterized protein n=1 Tax=Massarina eburnea CBS 473.64 TaxID=1395130 RepID=A0A6A6RP75_9PLEO|nr:hypothetical protein P280DRAFT_522236 [Massarina eburnea CBS 473.64]
MLFSIITLPIAAGLGFILLFSVAAPTGRTNLRSDNVYDAKSHVSVSIRSYSDDSKTQNWVTLWEEENYKGASKTFKSAKACVDLFHGKPDPNDKAWNNRAQSAQPGHCTKCMLFS